MRVAKTCLLACLVACIAQGAAGQMPSQSKDWPCAQRLVAPLVPGSYWDGPPVPASSSWRDDEKIFNLANDVVDRDTSDTDAVAKLNTYADTIPPAERAVHYPALFGALVDQTNDERAILIDRIEQLGRRQRAMADTIAKLSTLIDSSPPNPDLTGKRDFDIRVFGETQHTMRYACEAPANMDRRLGLLARALQAKLPK
jgi:hypothetical protein